MKQELTDVKEETILQLKEEIKTEDESFEVYEDTKLEASGNQIKFEDIELKEEATVWEWRSSEPTFEGVPESSNDKDFGRKGNLLIGNRNSDQDDELNEQEGFNSELASDDDSADDHDSADDLDSAFESIVDSDNHDKNDGHSSDESNEEIGSRKSSLEGQSNLTGNKPEISSALNENLDLEDNNQTSKGKQPLIFLDSDNDGDEESEEEPRQKRHAQSSQESSYKKKTSKGKKRSSVFSSDDESEEEPQKTRHAHTSRKPSDKKETSKGKKRSSVFSSDDESEEEPQKMRHAHTSRKPSDKKENSEVSKMKAMFTDFIREWKQTLWEFKEAILKEMEDKYKLKERPQENDSKSNISSSDKQVKMVDQQKRKIINKKEQKILDTLESKFVFTIKSLQETQTEPVKFGRKQGWPCYFCKKVLKTSRIDHLTKVHIFSKNFANEYSTILDNTLSKQHNKTGQTCGVCGKFRGNIYKHMKGHKDISRKQRKEYYNQEAKTVIKNDKIVTIPKKSERSPNKYPIKHAKKLVNNYITQL